MRSPATILSLFLIAGFGLASRAADDLTTRAITFAAVPRTATAPVLDGDLSDGCWQQARVIEGFQLTAGDRNHSPQYATSARMLFDDSHLYVAFECLEPDIAGLKAGAKLHDDPDMEYDDRVEVFLDPGHDHRHYWELAVNPAGTQFDQAAFHRLPGSRTCDFFPEQNLPWRARTKIGTDRWTVEIAIDVTTLGLTRLEEGVTWGCNLARVRRPDVNHGDELLWHRPGPGAEYSAWVPVQDSIGETISNFHSPIEFADVVFGDPGFTIESLELPSARHTMGPVGRATEFGWNPLNVRLRPNDGRPHDYTVALAVEPPSSPGWSARQTATFVAGADTALRYYVSEDAENKLVLQILDPVSGRPLYRTSYVETVPPFAEFDLSALYPRVREKDGSLRVRVVADAATRAAATLSLSFRPAGGGPEIQPAFLADLAKAGEPEPVFDLAKLRALPGGDYVIDCRLVAKDDGRLLGAFQQKLTKPAPVAPRFSAERTSYSFGGVAADAIRVRFPFAAEFVFWRGANYMPWWDMDELAMSYQSGEAWGGGSQGCNEAMQDRDCRYSQVELVEHSPARAVVRWRYALGDAHYRIYHNEWVDEYFTLYPDGSGVRQVNLWANVATQHEVLDTIMVKPPGTRTGQLFEGPVATLANLNGQQVGVQAFSKDRTAYGTFLAAGRDFIAEYHFKDRMHPYLVFSFRNDLLPGVARGMVSVNRTLFQNAEQRAHWPLGRYPIDGYNAVGLDVPTHFGFGNIHTDTDPGHSPNRWLFLIGASEAGSDTPALQARAWLYPAQVKVIDGATLAHGYDAAERAYRFATTPGQRRVSLRFDHDGGTYHPALLVATASLPVIVRVDGRAVPAADCAIGRTAVGDALIFLKQTLPDGALIEFDLP
jgi:hypothetical protein